MKFLSTRGGDVKNSSRDALLQGIASDGGLFMPEEFRLFEKSPDLIKNLNYRDIAFSVLKNIFDDFTDDMLREVVENAYEDKFSKTELVDIADMDKLHILELFHGPTSAFKDFALSILPELLKISKGDEKIAILTATSGDTGKAALEGFKDIEGFEIAVFYPTDGVSKIQKRQMCTTEGKNVKVVAIEGNFDDAQSALKNIFVNEKFKEELSEKGIVLSSANSINIGRLIPQIAYFIYAYYDLVKRGVIEDEEYIDVAVPTGNFGDILAAYLAKLIGIRIDKLICASNRNNVLTEFFNTGIYDANREFFVTNSPSMDILISSNLERLIYLKSGKDTELIKQLMENLKKSRKFELGEELFKDFEDFVGYYLEDEEVLKVIDEFFNRENYLLDTHTAVAVGAVQKYLCEQNSEKHILVAATASAYKFPEAISKALGLEFNDDFEAVDKIHEFTKVSIPENLKDLDKRKITQDIVIEKDEIESFLRRNL